jgi:DNA-binding MarR family transcriptional regulator
MAGSRRPGRAATDAVTDAVLTASRLLVAVSASSIASAGESITIPQFRLLVVLYTRGSMNLSVLADRLGVNPSATTRMVNRLVFAGMVDRQVNPTSRREVLLDLTEAGDQRVTQVTRQRRRQIARIVARMPERRRAQLVEALEAFNEAAGEPGRPMTAWSGSDRVGCRDDRAWPVA